MGASEHDRDKARSDYYLTELHGEAEVNRLFWRACVGFIRVLFGAFVRVVWRPVLLVWYDDKVTRGCSVAIVAGLAICTWGVWVQPAVLVWVKIFFSSLMWGGFIAFLHICYEKELREWMT